MSENPERSYCRKEAKSILVCVSCYTPVELVGHAKNGCEIWRCGTCGKTRNRKQRFWMEYYVNVTYPELVDVILHVQKEAEHK